MNERRNNQHRRMHARFRSPDRTPPAHRSSIDPLIDRGLTKPVPAPDMTRSIMGRLGYMRVPPQVARRRRVRRLVSRSALVLLAICTIGLGIQVHNASPGTRGPADVTIPSAITNDFQQHHHRMNNAWRVLQEMTPTFDHADWTVPTTEPAPDLEQPPSTIDEDVNRSAIAPVRWI